MPLSAEKNVRRSCYTIAPHNSFSKTTTAIDYVSTLRPDFTSKLVRVLAFGTPKFYIASYDKIKHELVNLRRS